MLPMFSEFFRPGDQAFYLTEIDKQCRYRVRYLIEKHTARQANVTTMKSRSRRHHCFTFVSVEDDSPEVRVIRKVHRHQQRRKSPTPNPTNPKRSAP